MPADNDYRSSQRDTQGSDPMAEHKRRARWRLFGAILIAGSVAAITPFLLEEQARPLSQDLLIEIPSKNSKFTKIDSLKPQDPAAQESASSVTSATPVTPQGPVAIAKSETTKEAPAKELPAKQTPAKQTPAKEASPTAAKTKGFMVQVGAYSKPESAASTKKRMESGGHRVVTETIKAADGSDRHRVRIGPFETREAAEQVRDRAKAQGYDAIVVSP
ncbi:MAG: SPOR domain-containing protein [Betaproteobacteria bacterium]|jgi:DedD protein|nr:SPOR domain-containing protein [Betaproteobacteria bacterium]